MAGFPIVLGFDAARYTTYSADDPQARAAEPLEERERLQRLLAQELFELRPLSLAV
jgi:hypothetical protein